MYVVELHLGCWLADWEGDPGRTVVCHNARRYPTKREAELALRQARRYRDYKSARIVESTAAGG